MRHSITDVPCQRYAAIICVFLMSGCASVQYQALEKVGIHKRDILVDRVKDAKTAQTETKEQFISAYDEFKLLVGGGDAELDSKYKRLAKTVEKSEKQAQDLDRRINAVDKVAQDLFKEWESELEEYTNASLRKSSEDKLRLTQTRYNSLAQQMRVAQSRVTPVLQVLQDNTLFLKHNLNAQAVSGMDGEVNRIEAKISRLIADMEKSIAASQEFVDSN